MTQFQPGTLRRPRANPVRARLVHDHGGVPTWPPGGFSTVRRHRAGCTQRAAFLPVVSVRLLVALRALVVLAHRVRRGGVLVVGEAVRGHVGVAGRLGEGVLQMAQSFVGEIEGIHVGARRLQSSRCRQVDP
ncbi:hypothetical protein ACGFX2_33320 [Streptomyces goshikiensis]|uniref:hypothetical protein n=1 Tax=Streptomyces goshikiensis TaxID=1942 RepID=UPI00371A081B